MYNRVLSGNSSRHLRGWGNSCYFMLNSKAKQSRYKRSIVKELVRLLKFTFFSISAGLVEIGTFTLLNELFHASYWFSYLCGLILSVLWNFTLNRKFTFQSAGNIPAAMLKVALFYVVFTPLSTFLEHLMTTTLGWNEYLASAVNMLLNFTTEFLYQRFYVFRNSIDTR